MTYDHRFKRVPMCPVERRKHYGPIQPMHNPTLCQRIIAAIFRKKL